MNTFKPLCDALPLGEIRRALGIELRGRDCPPSLSVDKVLATVHELLPA